MELIDREHLLVDVASLKQSPWFNRGKNEQYLHGVYLERKEAVETVEDLCIKSEPTVEAIPKEEMIEMYDKILKTSYDTAESCPKYKGIMLYEAQMIIDIMKEYLFKESKDDKC